MPLQCRLGPNELTCRSQEPILLEFALENLGASEVRMTSPIAAVRIVNRSTGKETLRPTPPAEPPRRAETILAPGQMLPLPLYWSNQPPVLLPGEYGISVISEYRETDQCVRVESPEITLKIAPTTPVHVLLDTVQGDVSNATWTTREGEIRCGRFYFVPNGGVREATTIESGSSGIRPVLSSPPNLSDRDSVWLAWQKGESLRFVHWDPEAGPGLAGSTPLSAPGTSLVMPLLAAGRADARVLTMTPHARELAVDLCVLALRNGQVQWGKPITIAGGPPPWIRCQWPSSGQPFITYVQWLHDRVRLFSVAWPDTNSSPELLAEWPGSFLACGTTFDFEDRIHGGTLIRGSNGSLRRVTWLLEDPHVLREQSTLEIPWDPWRPVAGATIRMSSLGVAASLIADEDGRTHVYGEELTSLAPDVWPVEIGFLGDLRPILVCIEPGVGFRFVHIDGRPL